MRKLLIMSLIWTGTPILIASPVIAQESESRAAQQTALMEKFAGTWKAEGTSFGLPSKSTMIWTKGLADKFYRIEYQIDMDRDGKTETFLGHGYYRNGGNDGFWADTGGALHPVVTRYTENMLSTIWGEAGGQQGRSNYTLDKGGNIEVVDWILRDDGWREFNRTMFRRVD